METTARTVLLAAKPRTATQIVQLLRAVATDPHRLGLADAHYPCGNLPSVLEHIGWDCVWHHPDRAAESMWEHPRTEDQIHVIGGDVFARPAGTNALVVATDPQEGACNWVPLIRRFIQAVPQRDRLGIIDVVAGAANLDSPEMVRGADGRLHCPYIECASTQFLEVDYAIRENTSEEENGRLTTSQIDDHEWQTATWACATCRRPAILPEEVEVDWV